MERNLLLKEIRDLGITNSGPAIAQFQNGEEENFELETSEKANGLVSIKSDKKRNLPLNEPGQPEVRNPDTAVADPQVLLQIVNWLDVKNSLRYRPGGGATHCNIYARDYCQFAGAFLPTKLANDTFDWFKTNGKIYHWEKVQRAEDTTEVQKLANEGHVVVLILKRPGKHGHMLVVVPESALFKAKRDINQRVITPVHSQAGSKNFAYGYNNAAMFKDWCGNKNENIEIYVKKLKTGILSSFSSGMKSILGQTGSGLRPGMQPSNPAKPAGTAPVSLSPWQVLPASAYAAELVKRGETDPNKITDEVFYHLYPEQKRPLEKGNNLTGVWLYIRDNIVNHVIFRKKDSGKSTGKTSVSNTVIQKIIGDTEIMDAFRNANRLTGVPIRHLMVFAYIESRGDKNARRGKYKGLMQMGEKATQDIIRNFPDASANGVSWNNVINDVKTNVLACAYYIKLNRKWAGSQIPDDILHAYLTHQQGAGGLKKIMMALKTNPGAKIGIRQRGNLPESYMKGKGGKENTTIRDFYQYYQKRIAEISLAFAKYPV